MHKLSKFDRDLSSKQPKEINPFPDTFQQLNVTLK